MNTNPYEPRTFSFIGDVSSTLMLIDDVGSDNLGITLDFCHMIMKKENPAFSLFQSARKTASSVSILMTATVISMMA
ncbi:sugar phosphate isomerase/epimerase [Klebsiella pneumoniae subsp. pneumoniae]|nr:sugar phosphate isomerase/epimerase [Klebsiella pneumoniae subsp. pneumoniae]